MKDLESLLFGLGMGGVFLTCILFVVFGQVTVRRLRKNPLTKEGLGIEFASGWDILNVAARFLHPNGLEIDLIDLHYLFWWPIIRLYMKIPIVSTAF